MAICYRTVHDGYMLLVLNPLLKPGNRSETRPTIALAFWQYLQRHRQVPKGRAPRISATEVQIEEVIEDVRRTGDKPNTLTAVQFN